MGSGWNLPDGCYESDLPGYYEVDETVEVDCPECGRRFTTDVTYDSKSDKFYEVTCDKTDGGCGFVSEHPTPLGYYEWYDDDDRADDYDAQDHPRY